MFVLYLRKFYLRSRVLALILPESHKITHLELPVVIWVEELNLLLQLLVGKDMIVVEVAQEFAFSFDGRLCN